jgi:protein SCO1/2
MNRTLSLAVAVLLVALGSASAQPVSPTDIGIDQRLNESVPLDLAFRDEHGDNASLAKYFGTRPVVLVLAYYRCPRLCNVSLNNLAASLGKIDYQAGRDFEVVIVSIDPRETPALAAAKKAALPGADIGWHLLIGDEPAIRRLADAVGFRYAYDAERDLYAHASGVMVLTPDGKIARYFLGLEHSPRDLGFALEDASAGKIGSPITQPLRLLCFAYDPETGKYSLMTMRLVQASAAFTVLLMGIFLVRFWRHKALAA